MSVASLAAAAKVARSLRSHSSELPAALATLRAFAWPLSKSGTCAVGAPSACWTRSLSTAVSAPARAAPVSRAVAQAAPAAAVSAAVPFVAHPLLVLRRLLTSGVPAAARKPAGDDSGAAAAGGSRGADGAGAGTDQVAAAEEQFESLTDRIPQRPVGVAEGASYGLVIVAGLAVAVAAAWAVLRELLFEPTEYAVFNLALDKCRDDARVTVRLGTPLTGYGVDSRSRSARQRIRHREYQDAAGVQHMQVQFQLRGPNGAAVVHANAVKQGRQWELVALVVEVGQPVAQQLVLLTPELAALNRGLGPV